MQISLRAAGLEEIANRLIKNIEHGHALEINKKINEKIKDKTFFGFRKYLTFTEALHGLDADEMFKITYKYSKQLEELQKWRRKIAFLRASQNLVIHEKKGEVIVIDSNDPSLWCFNFF
jgi:hypothetical protein